MKKTFDWFTQHNIPYEFHDYKKEGISEEKIQEWLTQKPWNVLINRAGTTWRKLSEEDKATDNTTAIQLIIAKPSMIKRPIVETNKIITMGFNPDTYKEIIE